jgi:3-phosphoglycerate kinase
MANARAVTIGGGGETAEAVEELGLADKVTHFSTGGGAFREYVVGTPSAALSQIEDKPYGHGPINRTSATVLTAGPAGARPA